MDFDSLQKCVLGEFSKLNDILADEYEAPIVQAPTPLEIQMAEQLKEQARQMEEMKRMMEGMKMMLNPLLEAEKERNRLIARRQAEENRRAEEQRIIEDEKRRIEDEKRRAVAKRKAEEHSRWRKAEEIRKAEEDRKQAEEERKQREIAEHPMRQEEARKRSAARVRSGEFSIWNHNGCEVVSKGNHVWMVDRTPIMLGIEFCRGPRLGSYMGINFGSIHWQLCGISRNSIHHNGVTYDGTAEPKVY